MTLAPTKNPTERFAITKDRQLVDKATGKPARFQAARVPGKGWSVALVIGSLRTGRTIERAQGFESANHYTMHQAQLAAENAGRDTYMAVSALQKPFATHSQEKQPELEMER